MIQRRKRVPNPRRRKWPPTTSTLPLKGHPANLKWVHESRIGSNIVSHSYAIPGSPLRTIEQNLRRELKLRREDTVFFRENTKTHTYYLEVFSDMPAKNAHVKKSQFFKITDPNLKRALNTARGKK